MAPPLVRFEAVSRSFGKLVAVDSATLDIHPGEVVAILGENGAGKSTLMKTLYGVHPPTSGEIFIDGTESGISGPSDAMRHGIGMVFQNFSLLPALSVRDNLLLAWPNTPFWKSPRNPDTASVLKTLARLAPHIDPNRSVGELSVGEQQIVELCKVLNINARVVILDEPSSVLTPTEARRLHSFIRQLADDGAAVVLITHKLADVEACADRIAIMRRGKIVDVSAKGEKSLPDVVALMMGQKMDRQLKPPQRPKKHVPRLVVQNISAEAPGMKLRDISLSVGRGEIIGVAGVAGNGQTLLAEAIAGIQTLHGGDVLLDGESIARMHPTETVNTPLGYIPEQPRENGVVETMSLAENLQLRELANGTAPIHDAAALIDRFKVNPPEPLRIAGTLSGGNVQKLVSARELAVTHAGLLTCYPTMGLDIAAIEGVYAEIFAQASAGAAVLWISEDLDDLLAAAHRIAVLREGRLIAVLDNESDLTRDKIGALMTGMEAHAA